MEYSLLRPSKSATRVGGAAVFSKSKQRIFILRSHDMCPGDVHALGLFSFAAGAEVWFAGAHTPGQVQH